MCCTGAGAVEDDLAEAADEEGADEGEKDEQFEAGAVEDEKAEGADEEGADEGQKDEQFEDEVAGLPTVILMCNFFSHVMHRCW
jgi:hypothetical protein